MLNKNYYWRKSGKGITIIKFNLKTLQLDTIYISKFFGVKELKVSPNQEYIAFIEMAKGETADREYSILPENQLRILDKNGRTVKVIKEDVRRFIWSPKGNRLALIAGSYYEGGIGFKPQRLFIFDIGTDRLDSLSIKYIPYEIYWSSVGNYLYGKTLQFIEDRNIFQFNLSSQQFKWTNFKDIWFSPDEKYYVHFPDQISYEFVLYESATNRDITRIIPPGIGSPVRWISNSQNYFLFKKVHSTRTGKKIGAFKIITKEVINGVTYTVFDVDNRRIVKKWEADSEAEFVGNASVIVFRKQGKILVESFE
ncbi:MAG: hypothetical protein D6681_08270 [Calditrichaeota bacterium]|nr:MAG: hypothetical protein D6681_08270 [Calditrichota bacterium]